MTIDQFDCMSFKSDMKAMYDGQEFDVVSVDFEEKLIGLEDPEFPEETKWVRCENCQIINQ
jgi:hypothetical protein